jgi:hypothetical protein
MMEEGDGLLAATQRLRKLHMAADIKTFHPGPASLHYEAFFVSAPSVEVFTEWSLVSDMLKTDPCTRLEHLSVHYSADVITGLQTTYLSSAQSIELPLRTHSSRDGRPSDSICVLDLSSDTVARVGVGLDERSRLRRLHVQTNRGRELDVRADCTCAAAGMPYACTCGAYGSLPPYFMHYDRVPRAAELAAFCGQLRPHDMLIGFVARRTLFWPRWGWIVLWRARLEHLVAARTVLLPPDASRVERLARRLVLLESDDLFRKIARHLA